MISRPLRVVPSASRSPKARAVPHAGSRCGSEMADLQTASGLLGQGAGLVFGHIRARMALSMRSTGSPSSSSSRCGEKESRALMQNLLPWPDRPKLSKDEQDRLGSILLIEKAGLPPELAARQAEVKPGSENFKYFRARALAVCAVA